MDLNGLTVLSALILFADTALVIVLTTAFIWAYFNLEKHDYSARTLALIIPIVLLVWFLTVLTLSYDDFFKTSLNGPFPPNILYGIAGPIILFAPIIIFSKAFKRLLNQFSQTALIGLQTYRTLGALFFYAYFIGFIPAIFAFPTAIGDILTGLLAFAVIIWKLGSATRTMSPGFIRGWNIIGIGDLMIAVSLGFLTSPGPFQVLSLSNPNQMISLYPLVLIPVFAVPLSILLHICSLVKLNKTKKPSSN